MPNYRAGKHVNWRRDSVILERLPIVGRLHVRRVPNTHIAAQLGVDEATVRRDLERWNELWREHIAQERATLTAGIIAELDDTRERALAAAEWDQQCEEAVLYGVQHEGADGQPRMVYRDAKGSAQFRGNKAAALGQARQATMDKAKVLGLVTDPEPPAGEQLVRVYVRTEVIVDASAT